MRAELLTLMDGSKLPKDQVLGVITIFTVPDAAVDGTKLNRLWQAEGLDPAFIPDVRKPVHVFQQACRHVETRRGTTSASGHRTEVKVDEVVDAPDECVYQVTRMIRDDVNRVIDHPKAMRVVFKKAEAATKASDTDKVIEVDPLDPTHFGALKGLAETIIDYYKANLSMVPGQKIRNAFRDCMHVVGGENLRRRSGGVYFVPSAGLDTLESIERVIHALYGDEADLHIWAQPKTKAVAKIVAKHHTLNVQSDADEMIAKISERLKRDNGKVRKDLLTNLMQQRRELGTRRKQYVALLGGEQKLVKEKLEILDDQLDKLMARAV